MIAWRSILSFTLALLPVAAQIPPSETLSDSDRAGLHAEIDRLEKLLPSAPDQITVTYEIARAWAAGKQWREAMDWLRKAVARKAGLDPSRDRVFAGLREANEFAAIATAVRNASPPVSHSVRAFQVREGDLVPESMAYDAKGKQFYLGSTKKGKLVRCSASGACQQFVSGLDEVLGMKIDDGVLWLASNSRRESALLRYDLASGALHKYAISGEGHEFNDLVIGHSGDVFVTDTPAGEVWRLTPGGAELEKIGPKFPFANGIAISPDDRLLYVSTYPDGTHVVDLKTGESRPIGRPDNLCLATIDGLYFYRGALIAIQNAIMTPRVVRFHLSRDLRSIERFDVLERRNPLFDGITTGVVVDGDFFYMANIQDEKKSGFVPITILKLRL
jgi:sugar lactone lactonase YvrE